MIPTDNIWLVSTEVRTSTISGNGRFAAVDINADTIVCILNGNVIPVDGIHLPIAGTGYCIQCPNTMINHSRSPNLVLHGQMLFKSNCTIAAGTELTLDYRTLTKTVFDYT